MGFNKSFATAFCLSSVLFSEMTLAAGIPVYDVMGEIAAKEGPYNAAHSILDGIRSQTEALLNAQDYVMRTEQKLATSRDIAAALADQKLANSYAMEPDLGAKPRVACGQYGAAALRGAQAGMSDNVKKVLAKNTAEYNQRNRRLAANEPRRDYAIKQILTVLDDKEKIVQSGVVLLEDEPIPQGNESLMKKLVNLLLNPFPVEEPTEADVARIKESGTPAEREGLAQSVVMQKRMEAGQYVFDQSIERNRQVLDTKTITYMLKDIEKYLSDEDKKLISSGKISSSQLEELMATYRVKSPKWVAQVMASPSQESLIRDQSLMTAELLNQLWELNQTNRQIAKLLAMDLTREISQSGLQSR